MPLTKGVAVEMVQFGADARRVIEELRQRARSEDLDTPDPEDGPQDPDEAWVNGTIATLVEQLDAAIATTELLMMDIQVADEERELAGVH